MVSSDPPPSQVKVADHKTTADLAAFRDKLVNKVELKAIAAAAKAAEPSARHGSGGPESRPF